MLWKNHLPLYHHICLTCQGGEKHFEHGYSSSTYLFNFKFRLEDRLSIPISTLHTVP